MIERRSVYFLIKSSQKCWLIFICRRKPVDYETADDELFSNIVLWLNHVLHMLLPPPSITSQRY